MFQLFNHLMGQNQQKENEKIYVLPSQFSYYHFDELQCKAK